MFSIYWLNVKSEYLIFLNNFIYLGVSNPNINTLLVRCLYNNDVLCCIPAIHLNLLLSFIET